MNDTHFPRHGLDEALADMADRMTPAGHQQETAAAAARADAARGYADRLQAEYDAVPEPGVVGWRYDDPADPARKVVSVTLRVDGQDRVFTPEQTVTQRLAVQVDGKPLEAFARDLAARIVAEYEALDGRGTARDLAGEPVRWLIPAERDAAGDPLYVLAPEADR